ncbi:MAG: rhamnulokinase [Bacteroidales bacterium]|nr:rhamnulokinase [Bacteroidales bacterium]
MVKTFLAFDCGATSGRGILSRFDGRRFSMEEVCRFPTDIIQSEGKMFWDISSISSHIVYCLKQLGKRGIAVDSIGIDTWGVDFGSVDECGNVLSNPRCYRDPYTVGVPEKVFGIIPRSELYSKTGIQIMNFNTIFQLYAQTIEKYSNLMLAKNILFMPDLLSYILTGKKICEYTDATTSGMVDQKTKQFNKALLDRLGIRTDILLPITQPGVVVGKLKKDISEMTGAGSVPVVAVAGHDTASAIVAVPARDEHFAYLSSGTWSLMGIEVPAPIINERSVVDNFTNEGGVEGTTRFLKNITGMWLIEQCRKVWKEEGKDYSYKELELMAFSEAGYAGRINPDDPRFAAPENMLLEIKDALGEDVSDARVASCIYHSLAQRYADVFETLSTYAPFEIDRLHIIGGGSANDLLNQWTADAIGIPVVAGPVEATAIGNIMMQAKAAGLVKDRWEMRSIIAENFKLKTFKPKH